MYDIKYRSSIFLLLWVKEQFLYYFLLTGSIFLISGTKSYQQGFRQNGVGNIISVNAWLGCWQSWYSVEWVIENIYQWRGTLLKFQEKKYYNCKAKIIVVLWCYTYMIWFYKYISDVTLRYSGASSCQVQACRVLRTYNVNIKLCKSINVCFFILHIVLNSSTQKYLIKILHLIQLTKWCMKIYLNVF